MLLTKKRRNASDLEESVHMAERIELEMTEIKCLAEEYKQKPEKLDQELLQKLVGELKNALAMTKKCGETLREIQEKAAFS